jgi:hypothetical protein
MFKGFEYKFKGSELKFKAYEHNFQHGKDSSTVRVECIFRFNLFLFIQILHVAKYLLH